jgi:hypothetical protein
MSPPRFPQHEYKDSDYSPTPAEMVRRLTLFLRGFHLNREKPKVTDWLTVTLTVVAAMAALVSAWIFQGQLCEGRKATKLAAESFRIDERAWVELETIKPALLSNASEKFPSVFTCDIYPKNVGKTVARDVVVKAQALSGMEDLGSNPEGMRNTQDKMLLNGFKEMGTNQPVVVPANPVPKVLAPNSVSPVPFRLTCAAPQVYPSGHQWVQYLVGRIDYCDQFQIKHWLKFCFYVVNARGEIWACQEGNDEDKNDETPKSASSCRSS